MRIIFALNNVFDRIKSSTPVWLIYIFVLALILRVAGVWYGLPLFLNIDEPATVSTTIALKHSLNPGRFDWPSLFFYMNAASYAVLYVVKFIVELFVKETTLGSDASLLFVSRILTVIFGSITVFPVYFVTRKIFNSNAAAYISAIILAVLPIHVNESHLAKLDISQTFFVAVALFFILRVYKFGRRKDFIYTGVLIGIATSIKYNAFLMFLPLVLAVILRPQDYKGLLKIDFLKTNIINLVLAGIISIITFYIGTPYALLDYQKFWSHERGVGVLWQFENVGKITWAEYPISVYETFFPMYLRNMGIGIWIMFTCLLTLFLYFNKRQKEYILLLLPTLIISLYMSWFERSPDHYFIFLIPFYVPAVSGFAVELYSKLKQFKNFHKYSAILFGLLLLAPSIYHSLSVSYLYSVPDTRNLAYNWISNNLNNDNDLLLIYGDELSEITFKEKLAEAIRRVDKGSLEFDPPFYLMIGYDGLTYDEIMSYPRDPQELPGNSAPLLKEAQLLFYTDNNNRLGPPIYIFKVDRLAQ